MITSLNDRKGKPGQILDSNGSEKRVNWVSQKTKLGSIDEREASLLLTPLEAVGSIETTLVGGRVGNREKIH